VNLGLEHHRDRKDYSALGARPVESGKVVYEQPVTVSLSI